MRQKDRRFLAPWSLLRWKHWGRDRFWGEEDEFSFEFGECEESMEHVCHDFFIQLITPFFIHSPLSIHCVPGTAGWGLPEAVSLEGHSESSSSC